ncbi:MAG: tRNA (adenosine(37)-N6)-threonylcarbamoyltransferase complex transferase subunit TsaD [Deltaproteobacteria bacterium]|nr:tRNA (adenosine(37)-N6)-threonylcarbamoyltransferase complex transferase subunit TsaD [Deltaproteobacteria bacterium]
MLVLGIESSCDDTAAAVVKDGNEVLSTVVASQDSLHARWGGIVPELASRRHIEVIIPVVEEALERAGVGVDEIDAYGATRGPGLVGSILIGLTFAKAVSYARGKPFVGVNHIEAHQLAAFLREKGEEKETPAFPFVSLVVSGGHTALFLVEGFTRFTVLGQTRDDAAGEAFDKVAKLLGLGYPGGVEIDRLSREGDPRRVNFTRPYLERGSLEFSFSGLKTAVLNHVRGLDTAADHGLSPAAVRDVAASFQEAVVDVLIEKAMRAVASTGVGSLVLAGGVACNSRLRERLGDAAPKGGIKLFIPPAHFCTDNGATVAACAYHSLKKGFSDGLSTDAIASWKE